MHEDQKDLGLRALPDADHPIVVAVDFSVDSACALRWAHALADRLNAAMTALHVVHDPAAQPGRYAIDFPESQLLRMEEVGREMLSEFVGEHTGPQGPQVTEVISVGLPAPRILEESQRVDAAMIVMGSRGRTRLEHLLMGSIAEQVVRLSPIPVNILRAPSDQHEDADA